MVAIINGLYSAPKTLEFGCCECLEIDKKQVRKCDNVPAEGLHPPGLPHYEFGVWNPRAVHSGPN